MASLTKLNTTDDRQAIALLEPLIERAPEIAARVARHRPFDGVDGLRKAIRHELSTLGESESIELFRAHPELAPDNPLSMTSASRSEQGRLGLTNGANAHRVRLVELNARYRGKFGFPFITALVRHRDMDSVLSEFEARLTEDRPTEIATAIEQIFIVSSERVRMAFGSDVADAAICKSTVGNHGT